MALPIQRYRFNFTVKDPLHLNFYSGSMLRGAFGIALKRIVCMVRTETCKQCLLYRNCAYPMLFETPPPVSHSLQSFSEIPHPYVIEPPPLGSRDHGPGERFSFSMVLIGQALPQLPLVILAWQQAFAGGVGKARSRAVLAEVEAETADGDFETVYVPGDGAVIREHEALSLPALDDTGELLIRLTTPLRIQKRGKVLSHGMSGRDFVMALVRRYYLLEEFHTGQYRPPDFSELANLAQAIDCETNFSWCDWVRYSNRQQQKMALGGVMGELRLYGNLQPFLTFIQLGQWLHAGNKTVFGLGRYNVETVR